MRTLKQGSLQDISLDDNGDFELSDGKKAYGIILADAVRTVRREVQLDSSVGVPYDTTVWSQRKRLSLWKHYVRDLILGYDFVDAITKFDSVVDAKGILNYDISVETEEGVVVVTSATENVKASCSSFELTLTPATLDVSFDVYPISGRKCTVNWGDGAIDTYDENHKTCAHTFQNAGKYTIKISDDITHFYVRNLRNIITKAISWGDNITSAIQTYYSCDRLNQTIPPWGKNIIDAQETFYGCEYLYGTIPPWPNGLTNAVNCYYACHALSGTIPPWPDSVTRVDGCYTKCSLLRGNIPDWTKNIEYASETYRECSGLTGSIPEWNDALIDVSGVYMGCRISGKIPKWNNTITSCNYAFLNCVGLTGDIPEWNDSIRNVYSTYKNCSGLTGAWTDDADLLMPSRITQAGNCVAGTADTLRALFYPTWGGTRATS